MDMIMSNSILETGHMDLSDHPNLHDELEAVESGQVCLYEG